MQAWKLQLSSNRRKTRLWEMKIYGKKFEQKIVSVPLIFERQNIYESL